MSKSNIELTIIKTDYNFQILDIYLSGNGIIEPKDLKQLLLPENIDFTSGVIINGRAPIWLYSYLIHELHIASFVGIYDPRLGAVIVQTHKEDTYSLGDIIPNSIMMKYLPKHQKANSEEKLDEQNCKVVAFIGPPHSGKTIFLQILREQIKKESSNEFFQRDFFIIRGCPDGEGNWTAEIDAVNTKFIRYKNSFDDDFIKKVVDNIHNLKQNKKLIFVDCGGKIDKFNQIILNECTHSIIISKNINEIYEWIGLAKSCSCEILAIIESELDKKKEIVNLDIPLRLRIGPLVRGKENSVDLPKEFISLLKKIIEN